MEVLQHLSGDFLWRFFHIFFGIIWIGTLYYFNFMQTPFFAETDASTKNNAVSKLVPRALWWFRWGAMFTFLTGLILFYVKYWPSMTDGSFMKGAGGLTISMGATLGILMFLNVWLIIWPAQKVVIASTNAVLGGGQADPKAAAAAARAGVASRTNTLFSIPMLLFMVASGHFPMLVNPDVRAAMPVFGVLTLIVLAIEANAVKGKMVGPLKTVKGVIHAGLAMSVIFFVAIALVSTI